MRVCKRSIYSFITAACLSSLVAETAMALGEPIAFDGFEVGDTGSLATAGKADGEITADCPAPAICTESLSDNGMLQRRVTIPSGEVGEGQYIQFVLTEPGTTGDASADPFTAARGNLFFTNEDFVKINNRGGGLANKQTLIESIFNGDIEERFVNEVTYKFGPWAQSAANPWVDIHQEIATIDYSGVDPIETVKLSTDIVNNGPGFDDAAIVLIKEAIDIGEGPNVGIQKFQFDKRAGFQNYAPFGGASGLPGPENITWAQFETITAMWVGQILETGEGFADQTFGNTRFENKDLLTSASYVSLTDPEAASWPTPFATGTPGSVYAEPVETIASGMGVIVAPTATVAAPTGLIATVAAGIGSGDTTVVDVPLDDGLLWDGWDGWRVDNGVFTLDACTLTLPDYCGVPFINENGVMQRIIRVGGVDYVHSIVTEETATGDPETADFAPDSLAFKNETFVRYNSFVDGIISKLRFAERDNSFQFINPSTVDYTLPDTAGEFIYKTIVKTGWGHGGPLDPIIDIDQSLIVDEVGGYLNVSSMYDRFTMKRGETEADTFMTMENAVGNVGVLSSGFNFPIQTKTVTVGGAFNNTTHDGDGIGLDDPYLLPGNNGNLSWSAGDAISITWVGGEYVTSANQNNLSQFVTTSYDNFSTGDRIVLTETDGSLNDLVYTNFDPNPESWDPVFGPAPATYVDPFVPPSDPTP